MRNRITKEGCSIAVQFVFAEHYLYGWRYSLTERKYRYKTRLRNSCRQVEMNENA